jgi:hypothetical protein
VSGGTAAGANLFHRFNRFDTRGEISGVSIQNGLHRTVVLGVLDPLGSFLNKGISLSSPAHLFFLSPGGLHVGAGAQFFNTPQLTLSTASSLGLGSGRFDVFRTTASEAALLTGMPILGEAGLSRDSAEAQRNGITNAGDLVVDGGLIQVDSALLLDAQGGHLLLQAGSQLAVPAGSVELNGKSVTVAAGALVTTSALAPAAPVQVPGPTTAPAPATVVPAAPAPANVVAAPASVVPAAAVVATTATTSPAAPALAAVAAAPAVPVALPSGAKTNSAANSDTPVITTAAVNPGPTTAPAEALASTAVLATIAATTPATPVLTNAAANSASATSEAPALPIPAAVAASLPQAKPPAPAQISAPGLDGGVIRISASSDAVVAGQLKALGVAATASGTTAASGSAASDQAGKGGRIEVTGQRVALTGAALDASGPAGGGTVLLGGDVRGANPAVPNSSTTTVDGASTVRADALAKGDGGRVVLWSEQQTTFAGTTSARGGPSGGDGGFLEVSSKGGVGYSGAVDAAAPAGKAGSVLFDPKNIIIDSTTNLLVGNKLQFGGEAFWDGNRAVLTPSNINKAGSFFYNTAISLANDASFSTSFQFKISDSIGGSGEDGADGLVFVVKNRHANAIGGTGEGLGYEGIQNSLGIEFDTFKNSSRNDPSGNHVGVNLNGSVDSRVNSTIETSINNGLPWTAWVDYNDNSRVVDVRLANSNSRPDAPTLRYTFENGMGLKDIIGEVNGSSLASFGFTAATGGETGKHEILSWSLFVPSSSSSSSNPSGDLLLQPTQIQAIANQGTNVLLQANNDITLKPNSSITIQSPTAGSGGISMQAGRSITLQSPITYVGEYSGPINLIANDTSLLPGFRDIGAGNLTVDTGATLTSSQALISLRLGPGNDVYSPGVLQVNAPISASTVLARGASGITLAEGATLTASAPSGRAITLDAGSGAFLNDSFAGPAALSKQHGATWAIYADNPTSTPRDNLGGLAYNFKQYNQTFDTNQGSNPILGAGNGLFFANRPTLSVNLVPSPQVSKVYNGTNTANLAASNYSITGASPNDSIIINSSGTYIDNNVGTGKLISVSGLSISSASETSTATDPPVLVYGYSLLNSEASGAIGTITQAPLTISAVTDSRVYNGSTSSSGTPAVTSGQVFSGDTLSGLSQVFGSKNVLGANQSTLSVNSSYTLSDGNSGNNYAVSLATAPGTISEAAAVVTANSGSTVYNGAIQSISGFSASGLVAGETSADLTGVSAGASGRNAGSYTSTASGTAANYSLSFVDGSFSITQAPLTISAVTDSRVYNGSTSSSGTPAVTSGQVFSGDTLSGLSQVFGSKNVLGANQSTLSVNSSYTLSDGNSGNNYAVSLADVTGTINQLALSGAAIVPGSSIYGSALTPGAVSFGNIVGSDLVGSSASVNASMLSTSGKPIVGTYSQSASASLTGTDAGNYSFSGFTSTPNYTISKLALTGAGIGSGSSIYGSALAPGVVSFGNIVGNGASTDRVGSSASVNTSELSTSNNPIVGTYSQSASSLTGVDAGNYSFTGFTSTPNYTISKLALTGAGIGSGSSIYGSALAPGAVSFSNIVGTDAVGSSASVNTSTLSSSGNPIVGSYSQSASALTGVDAGNYSFSGFTSLENYSISRAPLNPSFSINDKPFDGNSVATIAGYNLQGVVTGDDVFIAQASATFDNAFAGNNKPVTIDGFSLSGPEVNNYQLSSNIATATASITPRAVVPPNEEPITPRPGIGAFPANEEPIKNNHANPGIGLQSAKISSLSNLQFVEIDSSNISPSASVAAASNATSSKPDPSQPTPSASAVSADSAAQGFQESDQRSAEGANTSLGLSNAGAGVAMSPARLQQLMQSAADLIRRYPGRMLNP